MLDLLILLGFWIVYIVSLGLVFVKVSCLVAGRVAVGYWLVMCLFCLYVLVVIVLVGVLGCYVTFLVC